MSLISRIASIFRRDSGPALRNKPGGLAWIRGLDAPCDSLNGRIVTCVQVVEGIKWKVDPEQSFNPSCMAVVNGELLVPGYGVTVLAMGDCYLEPIPQIPSSAKDESTEFYPPVPTDKREGVTA